MNIVTGISDKQRRLLVYDDRYNCYDGKTFSTTDKHKIKKYKLTNSYRSKYIPIYKDKDKTLKETFDNFVLLSNELRKDSDCVINLYKTGTYINTALKIFFDHCNENNIVPEPIDSVESHWIESASVGGLMYSNDTYVGIGYKYDVNSFYPSIMKSSKFKIPIKAGTFETLSVEQFEQMKKTFFRYGIYRAVIDSSDDLKVKKLFRFNKTNYYTTADLRMAVKLGLSVSIINDDKPNFLFYGKSCMTGSQVFKPFVDLLYNLKSKNKKFKIILNVLWGSLCSRNTKTIHYDINKDFNYDLDTEKIDIINQYLDGDTMKIEYSYKNKLYKYPYARLKPFILSQARHTLADMLFEHVDTIEHVHTDSCISSKELDFAISNDIGRWKFEGCSEVKIDHINKVIQI